MPDSAAASLTIRLLGPFDVRRQGVPLPPLRSRKGMWLLALLVLRQGREVQREWLAEALWPDSLTEEALTSLRVSLADLRKALGPEAARLQAPTARSLRLDLEGADVDLLAFDRAIARRDPASLEAAVARYSGPFLEGCTEVWALPERDAREQAYLSALETLAAHASERGDYATAIGLLRRGVDVDLLKQSLHRALMGSLAQTGDYEGATRVYQDLRRRLHETFYAEPHPDTSALYQQLRAQARRRTTPPSPPHSDPPSTPPPCRLPQPLTALIGREQEVREIEARLLTARLVTLAGIGGIGKTRLALHVAQEVCQDYADGAAFVDLSALTDPASVPRAVAAALCIVEAAGHTWIEILQDFLRSRQLLLLLDNCEHLIEAAARLAHTLLQSCPGLHLLATSRERLGIVGEVTYRVPPLALPENRAPLVPETMPGWAAFQLFAERVAAVQAHFSLNATNAAAVLQICRQLDGIPLAIELAAALAESLSPEEIAARMDDRFQLLTSGDRTLPARHQTLHAMLDWSYDLLALPEQALLRRLAAFAGSFPLEAVEAISSNPQENPRQTLVLLSRLIGKSLVMAEEREGKTRYRLLETIRQYAWERLEAASEADATRARHRDYYLHLAEEAAPELTGPEQTLWLARLEAEYDNLRVALAWSLGEGKREEGKGRRGEEARQEEREDAPSFPFSLPSLPLLEVGLRLAGALGRFWQIRGSYDEGRQWLSRALAEHSATMRTQERAQALSWAGFLAIFQGDYPASRALCDEAQAIWSELGEKQGMAGTLGSLGIIAKDQGDLATAQARFEASLALQQEIGDRSGMAGTLGYLGIVAASQGDVERARSLYEASLALRRECGDRWGVAASLNNLGLLARSQGDVNRARTLLEESLVIRRELGDRRSIAITLNHLGLIACAQQDYALARAHFAESLQLAQEIGDKRSLAYSLEMFAHLAVAQDDRD